MSHPFDSPNGDGHRLFDCRIGEQPHVKLLGGWQLAGTIFQSGTPFSVANGFDRDNYADNEDRADIGNPNAPLNTRAILSPGCATGYQNPDTLDCVNPSDVHRVEGIGFPNASAVGRNTLRTGGTNNFDLNLTKLFAIAETRRLELRWEALNAFNGFFVAVSPLRSTIATTANHRRSNPAPFHPFRSLLLRRPHDHTVNP